MGGSLDKQRKAFKADPDHSRAFEALEEHYFLQGDWELLVGIYRHRLTAESLREEPSRAAPLVFRLAQIVEERLEDSKQAHEYYRQCAHLDPTFRPALQRLRRIHASRGQWDLALQIAELESQSNMPPEERADFLAEMGDVWLGQLDDPKEALAQFQASLGIDANNTTALSGLARTLEQLGRHAAAGQAWERLIANLHGVERADALVALARLSSGPLENPQRAIECYQQAFIDDPNNEEVVCELVIDATAREQWSLLKDLYERRFDLAMGAMRRTTVAIEAGHFYLDRLNDPGTAGRWFERAFELGPDDLAVHHSLAELARRSDDTEGLLRALDGLIALRGDSAPTSVLLEAADAHASCGQEQRALQLLARARERSPDNVLVLDALADALAATNQSTELCDVLETRAGLADDDRELRAEIYNELARRQRDDLGDAEAARDSFQHAFEADPQSPDVASQLAQLLEKAEAWNELERHLERARSEGPAAEQAEFHCALGELRLDRQSDPDGAREAFEGALETTPDLPRALQGLLKAALVSGDADAQIDAYQRAARAEGDEQERLLAISELVRLLEARSRIPEAIEWLEQLEALRGADRDSLETLVRLAALPQADDASAAPIDREKLIGALERLDEVMEREEPDAFDVSCANRQRLAALHADAGRPEQAIHWYEASLSAEPDNLDALLALRGYYEPETRPDDRIRIERCLAEVLTGRERAEALAELASLLETRSGDFAGAIETLQCLLAIPDTRESTDAAKGLPGKAYEERLEKLLERTGRFEDLLEQLGARRARHSGEQGSEETLALDLRRADLLLERLERAPEAAELYRAVLAQRRDNAEASQGLERAVRMQSDPAALASLLVELSEGESDPLRRNALCFEHATLLEGPLDDPSAALAMFRSILDSQTAGALEEATTRRVDSLSERTGDFAGLRKLLEAQLVAAGQTSNAPAERVRALHERLAALCRDRLSDTDGCIEHLEAVARAEPGDPQAWHPLATLYADLDRPFDVLRVTSALLACSPTPSVELALRAKALRLSLDRNCAQGDRHAVSHAERLFALDQGHAEAAELLCSHYEREGRPADVVRVLESRLQSLVREDASLQAEALPARSPQALARTALRLRIARIRQDALGDLAGAINALEPALEDASPLAAIADPLAALYERAADRNDALADLCRRCAEEAGDDIARIRWQLRLASALAADRDRVDGAVQVYEEVLEADPQEPEARASLRELYRDRGDHAPLARLLERELALTPEREVETLEELAPLLEEPLGQPEAALPHWLRILEVEPTRDVAFRRAMSLSSDLSDHETQLAVVERRLQLDLTGERAMLLELRGDLLAGALDRPREALAEYRKALELPSDAPHVRDDAPVPQGRVRRSLRNALERLELWPGFLECIEEELADATLTRDDRASVLRRAADVAFDHIGPDAALPWLERLRALCPRDRDVIARIASLHRSAGRHHALLGALDHEIELLAPDDGDRRRELRQERASLFEDSLGSPAAAARELESLRAESAHDTPVLLATLDRLYGVLGRDAERCEILEARLAESDDAERRAEAARLCSASLDDPDRAVVHWLHALSLAAEQHPDRIDWLQALAADLERAGRWDAWTQAVEAQLAANRSEDRETSISQRDCAALHASLARVYAERLGRSRSAARHWRSLLEVAPREDSSGALLDQAERALISQLREEGSALELEACMQSRLGRGGGDAEEWLELARLRLETLAAPAGAVAAFGEVLAREPASRAALGGLRRAAEALGDWARVAQTLEWELERVATLAPEHRAGMTRRLGELRWHELKQPEEAARAFAKALEAVPGDLQTLRAFAHLCEENGKWSEAVALLEEEVRALGSAEPAQRQKLWLRIAQLCRDRCDDPQGAIRAYRQTAALGKLAASERRRWAELHREASEREHFVEVFSEWCDDATAELRCADLLTLASELEELDRSEEALERVHQAELIGAEDPAVWDLAARLERGAGHRDEAVAALERAAKLRGGSAAAERLEEAAQLAEANDPAQACEFLRRAAKADPGAGRVLAQLALLEERLDHFEAAEQAAGRALDLADARTDSSDTQSSSETPSENQAPLPAELYLACALAGGRSARRCQLPDAANRFFGAVLARQPRHPEALAAHGELLFEQGDPRAARTALELRLELGADPDRASHLAIIGTALLGEGDASAASERFAQALADDPAHDAAHSGLVQLHEEAGRIAEAIGALTLWASHQSDAEAHCELLLRAADLELSRDASQAAIELLRKASEIFPASEQAWLALCEQTAASDDERQQDTLAVSEEALEHVTSATSRARLMLLRGAALEAGGEREAATNAFGEGLTLDRKSVEAALSRGRLQRDQGHFADAAAGFRDFLSALPEVGEEESAVAGVALVYRELGRLLAGPLEDIQDAIRCYERAVALEPELSNVRDPLASLLTHFPDRWADAIAHHEELLFEDPARQTSLRCLLRIAKDGGAVDAEKTGLALLRALGTAAPVELDEAPTSLPKRVALHEQLEDETWERARQLLLDAAEELEATPEEAGADAASPFWPGAANEPPDEDDAFGRTVGAVHRRLIGAPFATRSIDEVASHVRALACVAAGEAQADGASGLAQDLDRKLSRRAHKRLRRTLYGASAASLQEIDFEAWSDALRSLATAVALDEAHGDLRSALVWLLQAGAARAGETLDLCATGDISARIAGDPDARALLRRVVAAWAHDLTGRI